MTRLLGIGVFAAGFLLISPALRRAVTEGASNSTALLHQYSPYSYAGLVLVVCGGFGLTVLSGSRAR
ncbi:MAG: hypothetical protein LAP40_16100 [Acidobacteriia bacterium]|nr:hypothetical protein [Terriglobia bacterium]